LWFIKPLGEDFTSGAVKPLRVALVEPVAYHFQLCLVTNQRGETVLACEHLLMVKRRERSET
jgi:hypothetical protein